MSPDSPNFASWSLENLANFAKDSYSKMQEQQQQIEQLKLDLRVSVDAYRQLMVEQDARKTN